jgi:hypothetical protein
MSSVSYFTAIIATRRITYSLAYGVVVPVLPFALTERLGVPDEDVQKWNSILLGVLGIAILVGSSMLHWSLGRFIF